MVPIVVEIIDGTGAVIPRPTRHVAGTRAPNRGEYQPAIGSTFE